MGIYWREKLIIAKIIEIIFWLKLWKLILRSTKYFYWIIFKMGYIIKELSL